MPSRLKEMRILMLTLSSGSTPSRTYEHTFPKRRGPVVARHVGVDRRRGKAAAERSAESRVLCDSFGDVRLLWCLFRR